jgi:hypothetical protein
MDTTEMEAEGIRRDTLRIRGKSREGIGQTLVGGMRDRGHHPQCERRGGAIPEREVEIERETIELGTA